MFPEQRDGEVGVSFSYATAFGEGRWIWLMSLYNHLFWAGTIDERPVSEREDPELLIQ